MAALSRKLKLHPASHQRTDTPEHNLRTAFGAALERDAPPRFQELLERLRASERAEAEAETQTRMQ
ncbi:hypothetical protein D6850_12690 [Roseovarius spongiae]|uniref:Anti-sigma factor NepR domain-containing protein n=1 Tax=Roseovarius spongiae TaxID=2320272 RepID=A0A3A8ATP5_9RHOB|nr:hypothetical protein [Roseovarius spongiae]RKF14030.1 hypothetical protein D6850_12690 [Roseovarius spongiae]